MVNKRRLIILETMVKKSLWLCVCVLVGLILGAADAIEHEKNLIWAQSPVVKVFSQSRLVGIQGDPQKWVPERNPQVTYITAPHYTWEFSSLAFNWNEQILYWSESSFKKIQGLMLNGSRETMTVVSGTSSEVYGIAIDWLSHNLYYTDALYNWVIMTSAEAGKSTYRIIVNDGLDNPHGIVVHPSLGLLFWSDWGTRPKIEISDLLGSNRKILVEEDMMQPKGLAIDFPNEKLYWVDAFKATIESAGFDGQGRKIIHTAEGSNFYGLALYEDLIFATDRSRDGMLKVFNQRQSLVSFTLSKTPYDILMYDQSRQPGNTTGCEDLGCQQLCVLDPKSGPQCLCGEGYVLDESDNTSCTYIKQFVHPSHIYAIGDSICQYPANIADMSLTNVSLDSQCFLEGLQGYMTLTFDARNHFLYYFASKTKTISRIPLELGGKGHVLAGGTGIVHGMSLDWVSGNLYWTDITHGVIRMGSQNCSYQTVILSRLGTPFGIAVHPGRRKIFWTDHGHPPDVPGKVETANMDGTGRESVMPDNVGKPNHIFIDFTKDNLYWTDSRRHHVRKKDLNTGRITVIFEQPDVNFFGITIFQDFLLWTDTEDLNGIHVARMDKNEKIRGIIHPKNGVAADLITFDISNQPWFESPCARNVTKCSQLCVPLSATVAKCLCGSGFQLSGDGFSCITVPVSNNFLLVNDAFQRKILQINLVNGVLMAVDLKLLHVPVALTYDPFDNKVFWSDNKAHLISTATIEGRYESIVMRFNETSMCNGLAADYINRLLFYTDAGNDVVGVVSMIKQELTAILVDSELDDPRDIVASPHKGAIYWTDWGKRPRLEMAMMDGSGREALVSFDNLAWPNGLALDPDEESLYWVDAHADSVNVISLSTRKVKQLVHEEGTHYFSLAVIGDFLYINDWKRNYLMRMNKRGGYMRRYGETVFTRIYGIEGFNSSEAFKGVSVCRSSACEHLCLPKGNSDYTCRCAYGYVSRDRTCVLAPTTTMASTSVTTTTTGASDNGTSNVTVSTTVFTPSTTTESRTTVSMLSSTYSRDIQSTSMPNVTISKRPMTSTPPPDGKTTSPTPTATGLDTTITTLNGVTSPDVTSDSNVRAHKSSLSGSAGLSTTAIIIIAIVVSLAIIAVVVVVLLLYRRRRQSFFPHDKLVESRSPSMQKITYPTRDEDRVTFEGGIENPTYDCLHDTGPGTTNSST